MEGPSFSLRPATLDDLPKVAAIERAVHVAPWPEENFRAELEKPYSQFLVMSDDETDEVIAGYIVFWLMFDEAQVLNVSVSKDFQRRGLARTMLRQVVNQAVKKNIRKVLLEVRKSNLPAIQLYQSVGFVIIHVRKSFYSNGEDAYQMALSFEDDGIQF